MMINVKQHTIVRDYCNSALEYNICSGNFISTTFALGKLQVQCFKGSL